MLRKFHLIKLTIKNPSKRFSQLLGKEKINSSNCSNDVTLTFVLNKSSVKQKRIQTKVSLKKNIRDKTSELNEKSIWGNWILFEKLDFLRKG